MSLWENYAWLKHWHNVSSFLYSTSLDDNVIKIIQLHMNIRGNKNMYAKSYFNFLLGKYSGELRESFSYKTQIIILYFS